MQHLTTDKLLEQLAASCDLTERELVLVDRLTSALNEIDELERDIIELEHELLVVAGLPVED